MVGWKQTYSFIFFTTLTVILDQFTKYIVANYSLQWSFSILSFSLVTNTGAGFGLFQGKTMWLALVSALVASSIILFYTKIPTEKSIQLLFALFLGGVIGNLYDRLAHGHVIDFITLPFWPSFNIADAAISIAVIGLVIHSFKS